jgi:hypothetical protein
VTAALEMAEELAAQNAAFAERLHDKYSELASLAQHRGRAPRGPAPVPLSGHDLYHSGAYKKFDPYRLREDYGSHQLRAVLERATVRSLREAVGIVESRLPDAAPASKARKVDMIAFIMAHVAGPGY